MTTFICFSLLIVLNVALAWMCKRLFGLKLLEAWPRYESELKNTLASFAPAILGATACLITYFIYLVLSEAK